MTDNDNDDDTRPLEPLGELHYHRLLVAVDGSESFALTMMQKRPRSCC